MDHGVMHSSYILSIYLGLYTIVYFIFHLLKLQDVKIEQIVLLGGHDIRRNKGKIDVPVTYTLIQWLGSLYGVNLKFECSRTIHNYDTNSIQSSNSTISHHLNSTVLATSQFQHMTIPYITYHAHYFWAKQLGII